MALRQLSREAGAVRLCDLDPAGGMLTIECRLCSRHGRYRLESLIEAYGTEAGLPEIRRIFVSGGECRGSVDPPRPCHARFPRLEKRRRP